MGDTQPADDDGVGLNSTDRYNYKWYPRPPEMLVAEDTETGGMYMFECVGTTDLERVWVPDRPGHIGAGLRREIQEKHGVFAKTLREARQLDGFVEVFYQHSFEGDKQYQLRREER